MTEKELLRAAEELGFSCAVIDTADIAFEPSFRRFCEDNRYRRLYRRYVDCLRGGGRA